MGDKPTISANIDLVNGKVEGLLMVPLIERENVFYGLPAHTVTRCIIVGRPISLWRWVKLWWIYIRKVKR